MEFQTVPQASIIGMEATLGLSVLLPIILAVYTKIKRRANVLPFFIGAGIFIGFALILEQLFHMLVFKVVGDSLVNNIWIYALYGGLAAGIFEETGRYIAMRFAMKKSLNRANAFMYGIGHGGAEAIIIVGINALSNLMTAFMVNNGGIEALIKAAPDEMQEEMYASISQLWTLPSYEFHLAGIERIIAILLQITFSLIIFKAVKTGQKKYILGAIGLHFFVDASMVICANYMSVVYVEVMLALIMAVALFYANKLTENEE